MGQEAVALNKPCAQLTTEGTSGARTEVAQLIPVDGGGLGLSDGDLVYRAESTEGYTAKSLTAFCKHWLRPARVIGLFASICRYVGRLVDWLVGWCNVSYRIVMLFMHVIFILILL